MVYDLDQPDRHIYLKKKCKCIWIRHGSRCCQNFKFTSNTIKLLERLIFRLISKIAGFHTTNDEDYVRVLRSFLLDKIRKGGGFLYFIY